MDTVCGNGKRKLVHRAWKRVERRKEHESRGRIIKYRQDHPPLANEYRTGTTIDSNKRGIFIVHSSSKQCSSVSLVFRLEFMSEEEIADGVE